MTHKRDDKDGDWVVCVRAFHKSKPALLFFSKVCVVCMCIYICVCVCFCFNHMETGYPLTRVGARGKSTLYFCNFDFHLGFSSAVRSSSTPNLSSSEALGSSDVNSDSLR